MNKENKTEQGFRSYQITQSGLNAYVMQIENKSVEQAQEQNRRHFKGFDQLPKGKSWNK